MSEHVVIVNRWRERYADYARYVDHGEHRVTYVSTTVGLGSVPEAATDVAVVTATDDLDAVAAAVERLAARYGPPSRLVALKEDDLLVGAALRERWGLPGPTTAQLLPFRDKLVMVQTVAAAGVAVPPVAPAVTTQAVLDHAAEHGWPLVVKPRSESSSAGVVRLDGPGDLGRVQPGEDLLVQAFDDRTIHHVDGFFDGTDLVVVRVSRYLNDCLGFRSGGALGSVEVDDAVTHRLGADLALEALRALTTAPTVFHLEAFLDPQAGTAAFLEVGARVGGAEIPLLWREVHGTDLMETAFRIQAGLTPPVDGLGTRRSEAAPAGRVAGWLLVAAPEDRPCRITEVTPMVGEDPGPYAEALLVPGQVLPAADSYYEHVGGRFRFSAASTAEVEKAVLLTEERFRVKAQAIGAGSAGASSVRASSVAAARTGAAPVGLDKSAQHDLVRRADARLALDVTLLSRPEDLAAYLTSRPEETVVVRPDRSQDLGSALFCRPGGPVPSDALAALWRDGPVVAHPYVPGTPWFADGVVVDGRLHLTDVWRCVTLDRGPRRLLVAVVSQELRSWTVRALTARLQPVVFAAEVTTGPVTFELVLPDTAGNASHDTEDDGPAASFGDGAACEDGSRLDVKIVKVAFRSPGEPLPTLARLTGPRDATLQQPARGWVVADFSFTVPNDGVLVGLEGLDDVRALRSYAGFLQAPRLGDRLTRTDTEAETLQVLLRHHDRTVVLSDLARLEAVNASGVFVLSD